MIEKKIQKLTAFSLLFTLAACGVNTPPVGVKIGKPYEVNGKTYYPAPVPERGYDKVGDASWYGPGFHGKRTASGERFDEDDITAAHPTLPMPSLVRVTNLKNGKSIITRINDRGPFHSNRIIDLSKKTAKLIGLKVTQPVRVEYLKKETEDYIAALNAGDTSKLDMKEINEKSLEKPEVQVADRAEIIVPQETEAAAPVQQIEIAELAAPSKKSGFSVIKEARADDVMPDKIVEKPIEKPLEKLKSQVNVLQLPTQKTAQNPVSQSHNSVDKFTILVGSFSSEENAKKLAKKIAGAGKVSVEKVVVKGKNMWRTQVIGLTDKKQAEHALELVDNAGVADARIIRK